MSKEWMTKEFGSLEGYRNIEISPDIAERWINTNTHNRVLSERKVKQLSQLMARGMWVPSPDCILFDENGTLMNGQHRLLALTGLKDSCPDLKINFYVIWGMPKKSKAGFFTMAFIDRVRVRTGGQNWGLSHGYQISPHEKERIASIINFLGRTFTGYVRQTLEEPEIDMIYQIYKKEISSVMEMGKESKRLTRAPIMAAFVFAAKAQPDKTSEFMAQFFPGTDLHNGSPVLRLREKILKGPDAETKLRGSIFKLTLTALKYYIEGEPLSKLYVTNTGFDYFWEGQKDILQKIQSYVKSPETDNAQTA